MNLGAVGDLWRSERGLFSVALLVAVSVMLGLGRVSAEQWMSFTEFLASVFIGGKTVSSAMDKWASRPAASKADAAKK